MINTKMMRGSELDGLDIKILEIISHKRHRTADDIYSEISGFSQGKFGRSLINLRLKRLADMGYIKIGILSGYLEERFVYSINIKKEPAS